MGIRFLKIAAVYFIIAVCLGLVMGIIHDFRFASVHAHLNLLGWVSMAIFGIDLFYFSKCGRNKVSQNAFLVT